MPNELFCQLRIRTVSQQIYTVSAALAYRTKNNRRQRQVEDRPTE